MTTRTPRWPLVVQILAATSLFVAALGTLWLTSSNVVGREERRASASDRLKRASDVLAAQGRAAMAGIRPYPEYVDPEDWADIDRRLDEAAAAVRADFPGMEGGYYVPSGRGRAFRPEPTSPARQHEAGEDAIPPRLYDDIETQADAAYRKKTALLVVEDIPPATVAIQTAPVLLDGRVVAATWTMVRLDDPIFLDNPVAAYRWFVGLALAGVATSSLLTFNLIATIRRQRAERDRLQLHLRRSERLAALGKLLAGVAHEVRNPLAGIRSTAQLWQRGLAFDATTIDDLVDEVDRLDLIVANLLQFSRAEAQPRVAADLGEVLAEAARLAIQAANEAGVAITVERDDHLPPVEMSPPAVLQILRNLTTNAIQAMPDGGTLRLAARADPARRTVSAAVVDGGPGLTDEILAHLFEPFFTTKASGTGLGLAIAHEIALAHGGELRAEQRPDGSGAIFTLVLPAASPATIPPETNR